MDQAAEGSTSARTCPFSGNTLPPVADQEQTLHHDAGIDSPLDATAEVVDGAAVPGRCPMGFGAGGAPAAGPSSGSDPSGGMQYPTGSGAGQSGGCPMGFGGRDATSRSGGAKSAAPNGERGGQDAERKGPSAGGKCPFGYDQPSGPKMTHLHCSLCKSLLHDVVLLGCGCRFCRHCVARFQDCPVCGADINSREPDAELQGQVDGFIAVHAGKRSLQALDDPRLDQQAGGDLTASRATFFLQLGLRSAAAGNFPAALERLAQSRHDLLSQVEEHGQTAELCSQLGAVCGSEGDCCRRLDDLAGAEQHYLAGVEHMQTCDRPDAELRKTLSVALNKLGDLQYLRQSLPAARDSYHEALAVRRAALREAEAGSHEETALAERHVDVAVSLAKVADIEKALGNDECAHSLFSDAAKEVSAAAKLTPGTAGPLQLKVENVQAFISQFV